MEFEKIIKELGAGFALILSVLLPAYLIDRGLRKMYDLIKQDNDTLYRAVYTVNDDVIKTPWHNLQQWQIVKLGIDNAKRQDIIGAVRIDTKKKGEEEFSNVWCSLQ